MSILAAPLHSFDPIHLL